MLKHCASCDAPFDPNSTEKKRAGGLIITCPECSTEPVVKHLGVAAGDGKASGVTVLAFESHDDRERYARFWRAASGMNVGKSCQIGQGTPCTPGVSFKTLSAPGAANHKGRA